MATAKTPDEGAKKVEKQLEAETGKDFAQTGYTPPTLAETDKPDVATPAASHEAQQAAEKKLTFVETEAKPDAIHGKSVEAHIVNDKDGQMTVIYNRQGYKERPIPAGWRLATDEEIAKSKAKG